MPFDGEFAINTEEETWAPILRTREIRRDCDWLLVDRRLSLVG
jgi:hypothetical protein